MAVPLWKEHSKTMNDRLIDHTNVLLLQPLQPGRGISLLPAVDPIAETEGARGLVIAQVFAVRRVGSRHWLNPPKRVSPSIGPRACARSGSW